jgi:hypothetical protein
MRELLRIVDAVLRNEAPSGQLRRMVVLILVGGAIYGLSMGLFAFLGRGTEGLLQMLVAGLKVPAVFGLTFVVTFPSLCVFGAILGVIQHPREVLDRLLAAVALIAVVLASLAPVLAFFSLSTASYRFMVLLNLALCGSAGLIGVGRLRHRAAAPPDSAVAASTAVDPDGGAAAVEGSAVPAPPRPRAGWGVHEAWVILFVAVGCQAAWILRPFVGAPGQPLELFRERSSNFFSALLRTIGGLFAG